MKVFKFDGGSLLRLEFNDGKLSLVLQAAHPGDIQRVTSASVSLNPQEVIELVNWLGDELIGDRED